MTATARGQWKGPQGRRAWFPPTCDAAGSSRARIARRVSRPTASCVYVCRNDLSPSRPAPRAVRPWSRSLLTPEVSLARDTPDLEDDHAIAEQLGVVKIVGDDKSGHGAFVAQLGEYGGEA